MGGLLCAFGQAMYVIMSDDSEKTQNYIRLLSVCLSIIYGEGDRPELLDSVPFLCHKDLRDDLRSSATAGAEIVPSRTWANKPSKN